MLTHYKSTPATKTGCLAAAALGMLLCASAHITLAAAADYAATTALASFDDNAVQTAGLTEGATGGLHGQARALAIQYRAVATSPAGLSAPVDAALSDLLARLHRVSGRDLGLSSERARQGEREVLLKNSDAFVRTKVRLALGKEWFGFVYADMGAVDSALRWQGLAGISAGHGVDLLAGWRRVTYHFTPGRGFDSLDFNGPFLGATLAW